MISICEVMFLSSETLFGLICGKCFDNWKRAMTASAAREAE